MRRDISSRTMPYAFHGNDGHTVHCTKADWRSFVRGLSRRKALKDCVLKDVRHVWCMRHKQLWANLFLAYLDIKLFCGSLSSMRQK